MKFEKGHKRSKGRPAGSVNKTTASAKEAFALAFEGIGGVAELAEWAKANKTDFFKLYARLIPVELSGQVQARITVSDDVPTK